MENALRRFKRKVQQEDIIKEVKRHSFYLKPGEKNGSRRLLPGNGTGRRVAGKSNNPLTGEAAWQPLRLFPFSQDGLAMPEFQDRVLKCVDCGADFVFTAGEQQFYHEKNFKNEPKRCKACKAKRQNGSRRRGGPPRRVETSASLLPVRPRNNRPLPSHSGPPGFLPGMLPEPKGGRGRRLTNRF